MTFGWSPIVVVLIDVSFCSLSHSGLTRLVLLDDGDFFFSTGFDSTTGADEFA